LITLNERKLLPQTAKLSTFVVEADQCLNYRKLWGTKKETIWLYGATLTAPCRGNHIQRDSVLLVSRSHYAEK